MEIFVSTGEVSGDLQGAALIEALSSYAQQQHFGLKITAIGGRRMAAAGATLIADSTSIASFGLQESLPMILPALSMQRRVQKHLQANPPDLIVLVDYEGFNSGLGQFCRRQLPDCPIVYYITPQFWVYTPFPSKVKDLVAISDRLLAIFPEEANFLERVGGSVRWVGHPLVDRMAQAPSRATARTALGIKPAETAIALLPASRPQEIKLLLPSIFGAAQQLQSQLPDVQFWIPLSNPKFEAAIQQAIAQYQLNATVTAQDSRQVLAAMDLALTKSGTVTLELALLNVPQVVTYRLAPLTMWVARQVLRAQIPFVSPPNLLVMEMVVPELLQEAATPDNIAREALTMLRSPERRAQIQQGYDRIRQEIGAPGVCDRAAAEIFEVLAERGKV